jgi:transcriptional regulator with XRE-family HTH domain
MLNTNTITWTLRACREARGFSQEYMADMLDIGQSAYANIESGKTTLSIERLIQITTILELNIHEILESGGVQPTANGRINYIHQNTREVYDKLIHELRNEVEFLRSLVRQKQVL